MNKKLSVLLVCLCLSASLFAADAKGKLPSGAAATVNGVLIPEKLVERNIQANLQPGQVETPELRRAILDELIARELFVQESGRLGLDKSPQAQDQLQQLRQGFLIDLLVNDYLSKNPLSESDLRAEYDRQIAVIGAAQQYSISHIQVATEAEAKDVLAALKAGQRFDDLARARSLDASKEQGGQLGWVLPAQVLPAISNVMVNLSKGSVTQAPIQTAAGWHVVKLDDVRAYKPPTFEESKNQLSLGLIQARRLALLKKLSESARVVR